MKVIFDPTTQTTTIRCSDSYASHSVSEQEFAVKFAAKFCHEFGFSSDVELAIAKEVRETIEGNESYRDVLNELAAAGTLKLERAV